MRIHRTLLGFLALAALACRPPAKTSQPSVLLFQSREACVDAWLQTHGFDRYGSPEGTSYAGGTPLFDESSGQQTDRFAFLALHRPAVLDACKTASDAGH